MNVRTYGATVMTPRCNECEEVVCTCSQSLMFCPVCNYYTEHLFINEEFLCSHCNEEQSHPLG